MTSSLYLWMVLTLGKEKKEKCKVFFYATNVNIYITCCDDTCKNSAMTSFSFGLWLNITVTHHCSFHHMIMSPLMLPLQPSEGNTPSSQILIAFADERNIKKMVAHPFWHLLILLYFIIILAWLIFHVCTHIQSHANPCHTLEKY